MENKKSKMAEGKRYLISTLETFGASFLGIFLIQIETILENGVMPTQEALIALIIASIVSASKVLVKILRESLTE